MTRAHERDALARRAVGLTLLYLALAFGWRTWVQWRRTGDTGFRLSAGAPATDRAASLLMIGGAVTGFAGAWAGTTSAGRRGRRAGLAGMTLALVATLRAQLDMGRSWRIGVDAAERTELVTKGTFSRSRNPIFTCMGGFAVATALAVPSAATLAGATLVITGVQMQVRLVEEPYLEATHGDAYRRYAAAVGRFVPGIGRLDRR